MMDRSPLDTSTLSPAAQKALGPGPGRMMAARGLVPLPPGEQIAVLYQLALDVEFGVAATGTAKGLPEKVIAGALADPRLDPRVVDFVADYVLDKPAAFEAIVQSPTAADETIARLAGKANANQVDRIAANEQRLLRFPDIIAAMYLNKHARMSTVDRAVELAVRNNVRVPNLPAWDEIARALEHAPPSDDALFAQAIEDVSGDDSHITQGDPNAEEDPEHPVATPDEKKTQRYQDMTIPMKIRYVMTGNGNARAKGIRDSVKIVALAAIKSPAVTEFEAIVQSPTAADETIARLAGKANASQVDRIAANEQRLLRFPDIIAAMYLNKHARMSTVDRAVELAVRNNVRVPNLAAWDEIARALEHAPPSDDALFAQAIEDVSGDDSHITQGDPNAEVDPEHPGATPDEKKTQRYEDLTIPMKIRYVMTGNGNARAKGIRDSVKIVALAAIKSPAVTEFEAKSYAGNQALAEDVIRYIAGRREWTKNLQVKRALCRNPKTPINDVAKLLPFLLEKDLQNLARSKGVPSAVAAQAKKLISQRKGGKP
ncbi:MAG TPA: hypothetical protein VLT45_00780 [Kofleriaceae bacterium]|nr:hypothetical protein [Kofleriaceae bacterium]